MQYDQLSQQQPGFLYALLYSIVWIITVVEVGQN